MPYEGKSVIEHQRTRFNRVLAGPFCSMMFADMGACVIKVENPRGGADERSMEALSERRKCLFDEPEQEQEGRDVEPEGSKR